MDAAGFNSSDFEAAFPELAYKRLAIACSTLAIEWYDPVDPSRIHCCNLVNHIMLAQDSRRNQYGLKPSNCEEKVEAGEDMEYRCCVIGA
jgi:hypothetical protein